MKTSQLKWYAKVLGSELGPMSFDCLERMLRDGELAPSDVVRRSDQPSWIPAEKMGMLPDPASKITLDPAIPTSAPIQIPESKSQSRLQAIRDRLSAGGFSSPDLPKLEDNQTLDVSFDPNEIEVDQSGYETPHLGSAAPSTPMNLPAAAATDTDPDALLVDETLTEELTPTPFVDPRQAALASIIDGERNASPPKSRSAESMIQGVGKAFRARKAAMRNANQPSLKEGLAELVPRWLVSKTTAVALGVVFAIYGLMWLFSPGYEDTAYTRLVEIRQQLNSKQETREKWATFADPIKPELVEMVDRMTDEASADNPPSQVILWASTEMKNVLYSHPGQFSKPLKEFDSLITEYRELKGMTE